MRFKVFYRYSYEDFKKSHFTVVNAFNRDDAEGLVKYRNALVGEKVHVITTVCVEEKYARRPYKP